jgi:hypothetical protein
MCSYNFPLPLPPRTRNVVVFSCVGDSVQDGNSQNVYEIAIELAFYELQITKSMLLQRFDPSSSTGEDGADVPNRPDGQILPQSARRANVNGRSGFRLGSSRSFGLGPQPGGSITSRPAWRQPEQAQVRREVAGVEVSVIGQYGHFGGVEAALLSRFGFSYKAAEPIELLVLGCAETARLFDLHLLQMSAIEADIGRPWRRKQAQLVKKSCNRCEF